MPTRQKVWARTNGTLSPLANGRAQASLDSQFATEYGTTRLPVGTTIGGILVSLSTVQLVARAASTDFMVFGIGLFDETTATEVPEPLTDIHADWMWRQMIGHGATLGISQSTWDVAGGPTRVKSMRKISELNIRPWLVCRLAGNTTVDVAYDISLMLLLP